MELNTYSLKYGGCDQCGGCLYCKKGGSHQGDCQCPVCLKGGSAYGHNITYQLYCDLAKKINKNIKYPFWVVGSTGRFKSKPEDIDYLTTTNLKNVFYAFKNYFTIIKVLEQGKKQLFFLINFKGKKIEINIWKTNSNDFEFAYFQYAFPKKNVIALRKKAKSLGYKLNQYGLFKNNKKIHITNYMQIFDYLQVPRRTPVEQTLLIEKYHNTKNTEETLKKIRKNNEVEKWINKKTKCNL